MANTELILGLAGIGGTLTAATIGIGSTLWLDRRRQAREERQERRQLRTAARLVLGEIAQNNASTSQAQPVSDGLARTLFPFEHSKWDQHAPVLATLEDHEAWMEVAAAYALFAVVASTDHIIQDPFADTLALQGDKAAKALRRHV